MDTVTAVAKTGDYEGQVTFGLALDHVAGFNVFTLTDPSRIVIDVAH